MAVFISPASGNDAWGSASGSIGYIGSMTFIRGLVSSGFIRSEGSRPRALRLYSP